MNKRILSIASKKDFNSKISTSLMGSHLQIDSNYSSTHILFQQAKKFYEESNFGRKSSVFNKKKFKKAWNFAIGAIFSMTNRFQNYEDDESFSREKIELLKEIYNFVKIVHGRFQHSLQPENIEVNTNEQEIFAFSRNMNKIINVVFTVVKTEYGYLEAKKTLKQSRRVDTLAEHFINSTISIRNSLNSVFPLVGGIEKYVTEEMFFEKAEEDNN